MNIPFVVRYTCPEDRGSAQQGAASIAVLCLLLVMAFLGRGVTGFTRQGTEGVRIYRQEMNLRLAAESVVEREVLQLRNDDRPIRALPEKIDTLLEKGTYEDYHFTVYARQQAELIYIIGCAFCRETELDEMVEPHVMVKGVLKKNGNQYVWLGWAP